MSGEPAAARVRADSGRPVTVASVPAELDTANFDELTSRGTSVIDFWAEWCGPCRVFAPAFDAVAFRLESETVRFFKLNVDQHPEVAQRLGVRSIPTVVVLSDGVELSRLVGAASAQTFEAELLESLPAG